MTDRISPVNFDPHQYAIDAGWSFDQIKATAKHGLADEDLERIQGMCFDGQTAAEKLEAYCRRRVNTK